MNIDFHSHILPGIDEGLATVEEAISLLKKEQKDNIDIVIATPRYDINKYSISDFITLREKAYTKLITEIGDLDIPSIKLGAEVIYSDNLLNTPDLHNLCIEGTDYLLLELPKVQLNDYILDNIYDLTYNTNIRPIISHVEESLKYTSIESLEEVLDMDVLGQINASSLLDKDSRKKAFKLFNNNYVHLIGSNACDPISNPVLMKEAEQVFTKKYSKRVYIDLMNNAKLVLKNISVEEILL